MEYPAPYLPDIIYLNGVLATQPEALDRETEQFVNSSGDAGVIIMSLGVKMFGVVFVIGVRGMVWI